MEPLKDALIEFGADGDEEILAAARELMTAGGAVQPAAGSFRIEADKIKGVVQAEKIDNLTVIIDKDQPVEMPAVDQASALGRYLKHVISHNRYLQLQGIRSGGKLVHIELDRIYITLRTTREREIRDESQWLAEQQALAPGEMRRTREAMGAISETAVVSVNQALAEHDRLVVLGDPGSGKTTLLRYLALLFARDMAEDAALVRETLGLEETGRLPILLPLRKIGAFLKNSGSHDAENEGHGLLLDFLTSYLKNERIQLPDDFFVHRLRSGKAVVFLDGLDEVADPELRRRVSRLVEAFTRAFPACRYVIASRIVGYVGPARLGENFTTTTVRDFSMADVEAFLKSWHRILAIGHMGQGESAETTAADQTRRLLQAIRENERIRE
ncbi:MAG: NACHT domain-containing protein, partial [Desulfobacterales bacterium]|nr:NACHT domain-containing protein [Desulfobacterales bacterium]